MKGRTAVQETGSEETKGLTGGIPPIAPKFGGMRRPGSEVGKSL